MMIAERDLMIDTELVGKYLQCQKTPEITAYHWWNGESYECKCSRTATQLTCDQLADCASNTPHTPFDSSLVTAVNVFGHLNPETFHKAREVYGISYTCAAGEAWCTEGDEFSLLDTLVKYVDEEDNAWSTYLGTGKYFFMTSLIF